eukprot:gene16609-22694_t
MLKYKDVTWKNTCAKTKYSLGASSIISTVVGINDNSANRGLSGIGDGGHATSALLKTPYALWVDSVNNIYLTEYDGQRIRKIDYASGIISTIAGGSVDVGFSGDGGPATAAVLNYPANIYGDTNGNIYFSDLSNNRVRIIYSSSGIINTFAGNGEMGYSGDGGMATSASIEQPYGIFITSSGDCYIGHGSSSGRIRKVDGSTNIITLFAGGGSGSDGSSRLM